MNYPFRKNQMPKEVVMKYLPRDVSTFATMIKEDYVYVDKTKYIYDLYSQKDRYHFLSRPRRFGKSLLISTLKELFSGNEELFQGLWIAKSDYQWRNYPIIDLDFSVIAHRSAEMLEISLRNHLSKIAIHYDVTIDNTLTLEDQLGTLIEKLGQINKVVLLIDEYDQPLISHLDNLDIAYANRQILQGFYKGIKGHDAYMQAIFITGVSKFSKTSIFSGINNLNDISMTSLSSQLLGYTKQEIETNFSPFIESFARQKKRTPKAIMEEMEEWYDGYRFSEDDIEKIYNPFSVTNYLKDQKRKNYWFESGTPTFLVTLMKKQFEAIEDIEDGGEISSTALGTFEIDNIPLIPLLFQTGYLTIKTYDPITDKFTLGYPNAEVSEAFRKYIVVALTRTNIVSVEKATSQLAHAINNNDVDKFCSTLQSLFAHIPYNLHIDQEKYYHSLFQFLGTLLGMEMQSEVVTDKGRIDLVLTTKTHIYIFELKLRQKPEDALKQIEERGYYERFLMQGKKIVLVGVAFNHVHERLSLDCTWKELQD